MALARQFDPNITPCVFCRRRIRVNGQPIFQTCSCKALGPPVTIGVLVAGVALTAVGLWWLLRRGKTGR